MRAALQHWFDLQHDQHDNVAIDQDIRQGVRIRGTNLWVLFFAILIASVGLNVNSTAVIIGAMLISPLMGPIIGIGYGAAISDYRLIRSAARGLAVFALLSLLTSAVYFAFSPLSQAQAELLARTTPTLWDVLIAFFGGCAGMIAQTRKEGSNVLPGAAIATALMPPLCTVGYGIASGNWRFAVGAAYLFLINAFFIALASYLFAKLLRLPQHEEADPQRQRSTHLLIGLSVLALTLPSAYLAYGLVQDQLFLAAGKEVVAAIEHEAGVIVLSKQLSVADRRLAVVLGGDPVAPARMQEFERKLQGQRFKQAKLVHQHIGGEKVDVALLRTQLSQDLQEERERRGDERNGALEAMRRQLANLDEAQRLQRQLVAELMAQYPAIIKIAVGDGGGYVRTGNAPAPALVLAIDANPALAADELTRIRAGLAVRFPARTIDVLQTAAPAAVPPARRHRRSAP